MGDQPRTRRGCLWWVGLAVVVVVGVSVAAALTGDEAQDKPDNPAEEDVEMTSCRAGRIGRQASGVVVNHSSKRSNYSISVNFYDEAGTQVSEGADFVSNLAPDGRATWEVTAAGADTAERCEIVEVTRFAA